MSDLARLKVPTTFFRRAQAASEQEPRWSTADKRRSWSAKVAACWRAAGGQGQRRSCAGTTSPFRSLVRQRSRSEFGGVPWPTADKMEPHNQRCKRPPRRGKFTKTGKHEENGRFPRGARGPEQALANGGQKASWSPE